MTTPILGLDEWESAQSQPEITVNTAIRWLECFATLSVISMSETDPPEGSNVSDGDAYIVADGATGAWTGQDQKVALYLGNAWDFKEAPAGNIAWVQDVGAHYYYVPGSSPEWVPLITT